MPDVNRLKEIRTFPMLTKYLRDDLDWPIESDSFEDITFEYEPEELGIEPKYANMIKEIRQLRPFTTNQPWGIFFINFDKKRLPVVMLRRILGALALKKRASANRATRPAWSCNDLLFISTCGEEESRSISFGHFQKRAGLDLPALRVVGWDKHSTQLRLEDAQLTLAEKLRYPDDDADLEDWRETWSSAFKLRPREVISTSKALAERLAEIAVTIRQSVSDILEVETEEGPMSQLLDSFRENLIHDLDEDGFADTYAQTLTYGLLTEKMIARLEGTSGTLSSIKLTNPFLSELLDQCREVGREQQQIDFDELGVGELEELLDDPDTKLDEVLKDFGRTATGEDPVLHFYELFLKEYDPKERKQRGVFYTPRPVVSYIVRSVHELLQTEFGLEDGLADTTTWGEMVKRNKDLEIPDGMKPKDPFVQILDPATGTATFLVETIEVIYQAMKERWKAEGKMELEYQALWNEYVPKLLLPRLHGYELMMAPYAIAHMKIGIKLYETGYRFKAKERARIYLTNALEPPSDIQAELEVISPALAHEAKAVNEIKHDKKFTVVIGNPPYSNFGQLNKNPFILGLLEDYKRGLNEKKINLDDDFIKFVRYAQHTLTSAGQGITGMITNNVYLDGLTHRKMRWALLDGYKSIWVLNLHGSIVKEETSPDGSSDENVFDIQQGVAISFFAKNSSHKKQNIIEYADLWGIRNHKYQNLISHDLTNDNWTTIVPVPKHYFFVPKVFSYEAEYKEAWSVEDIFQIQQNGLKTDRDELFLDFDREILCERISTFYSEAGLTEDFRQQFRVKDSSSYALLKRRELTKFDDNAFHQCLYRPFDERWIYYRLGFTSRPAWDVMQHMLPGKNIALIACRQFAAHKFFTINCTKTLTEISSQPYAPLNIFPLYLNGDLDPLGALFEAEDGRRHNLSQQFVDTFSHQLKLSFNPIGIGDRKLTIGPEDIFHYTYAVFHSPGYRSRYAEFLKIDFPRLPLTNSLELFKCLANLGAELVALHLMESPKIKKPITKFVGPKDLIGATDPTVGKASYSDETVWLDKNQTIGFEGVPEEVWNFHIGGYQVCHKWLKDRQAKGGKNPRPGRVLTKEDRDHYQGIIVALSETIRLMAEIDQVIDQHGGWPNAFKTKDEKN